MAAPSGKVDIVNLAALQLYQEPITSLEDTNNKLAGAASRVFDFRRRAFLRNYMPNFARKRSVLTKVSGVAPHHDFDTFYDMPNDCLRVLRVGDDTTRFYPIRYKIEGRYIAVNASDVSSANSIDLHHVTDQENFNLWDALYIEAFALDLAHWLCMPITGDLEHKDYLGKLRDAALAEAVAINHQENPLTITDIDRVAVERQYDSGTSDWTLDESGF